MRGLRLSTLLLGINVGLLLLAVAGVAIAAVRLLQQLGDEQALARVMQAGTIARKQINDTSDAAFTSAQLLSERPTLRRLLDQNDQAGLAQFLGQFQQTSQLDGTAVLRNGEIVTHSGEALPWAALPGSEARFVQRMDNGQLLLGASVPLPTLPEATVVVARRLDGDFAQRLTDEIGLPVTILPHSPELLARQGAVSALRGRAIASNTIAAARIDERHSFVAVAPLHAPDDAIVGLVETELPTAGIAQSVRQFVSTLLVLTVTMATGAGLISLLLGRRLGRPLGVLTGAAARIGRGDLLTPIPTVPSAEIGTLATTLEDMRWRLLGLTNDLRRQQAEAEAIVTGIAEGVFSVDRERRIHYLNPQAAMLLGTTPESAIGRFCGDVLHPQGPDGQRPCADHCPIIHARFRGGARATEHLLLPNGQQHTVVITSAQDVDGMQMQVLRDETEIEATRRLRDAILANISHEFRTPLSAQLASIELLLDQLPELSVNQIEQLVRSQQRGTLRQLIDNLLESARIEAGQHKIRRQSLAVDEVIEEALELVRPLFDQRGQEVVVDLPYPLPSVCGDARRLTQVFVNLLGNANKFAPADSTICIGGAVEDASITLWVEDSGPGLPTQGHASLFTRFVRSSQDEPEQSGVGLGLWLVKSIVERHDGHVDARSDERGTRISIILPAEPIYENSHR